MIPNCMFNNINQITTIMFIQELWVLLNTASQTYNFQYTTYDIHCTRLVSRNFYGGEGG